MDELVRKLQETLAAMEELLEDINHDSVTKHDVHVYCIVKAMQTLSFVAEGDRYGN